MVPGEVCSGDRRGLAEGHVSMSRLGAFPLGRAAVFFALLLHIGNAARVWEVLCLRNLAVAAPLTRFHALYDVVCCYTSLFSFFVPCRLLYRSSSCCLCLLWW